MNALTAALDKDSNKTYTLNGMKIKKSSQNALVDLFYAVGAARGQDDKVAALFNKALNADLDLAVRIALYARDAREGMGERSSFRVMLRELAKQDYESAYALLPLIPLLGRWDDVLAFVGTTVEDDALAMYASALDRGDALAAKWAHREKSAKSNLARKLREFMGLTPRVYRKMLSSLTNVVEQKMASNQWNNIEYSHVPSVASARYQRAFRRHDETRYEQYIAALERGDKGVKINAGAVYPYDIINSVAHGEARVADQQWKALPEWIPNDKSFIPLVDTSGSMFCNITGSIRAIDIALSLGLYVAERNKSVFKDRYLSFSASPTWVDTSGLTLTQKVQQATSVNWGMNTNIEAAYELILMTAVNAKVSQDDMPEYLIIFSDMQFDYCTSGTNSVFKNMKEKFKLAGYKLPNVVFWNLVDYGSNTPVKFDKDGTALVSGFSPALMKSVLSADMDAFSPFNVMLDAVMKDRYNWMRNG